MPEQLAAVRADHGGADEHAAVGVLDDLDEAVVARAVDPAAAVRRDLLAADPHRQPVSRACCSVRPTRPTSGSVKVDPGQPVVAADRARRGRAGARRAPGLPDRDVRERAAAGDVADRVQPDRAPSCRPACARRRPGCAPSGRGRPCPGRCRTGSAAGRRRRAASRRSTVLPSASVTTTPSPPRATRSTPTPCCTVMPSRSKTSATTAPASGSSGISRCGAASTTVTWVPKRAKPWASSQPIAPPPMTTSDAGAAVVLQRSRGSSRPARPTPRGRSARPSIGGIAGAVPVAMHDRARRVVSSPHLDEQPAVVVAAGEPAGGADEGRPRAFEAGRRPPGRPSRRWPRRGCGRRPGRSPAAAARAGEPSTRRDSASTSAPRRIIFDGMQPKYGHSPPTRRASTPSTGWPASATVPATSSPPGPEAEDDQVVVPWRDVARTGPSESARMET